MVLATLDWWDVAAWAATAIMVLVIGALIHDGWIQFLTWMDRKAR